MEKRKHSLICRAKIWMWLISLLAIFAIIIQTSPGGADDSIPESILGSPVQFNQEHAETQGYPRGNPKLGSSLSQLLDAHRFEGLAGAQSFSTSRLMVMENDQAQVTIVTYEDMIDVVRELVEAAGGQYQLHYRDLLQALVPLDQLGALAERPEILYIREPYRAIPMPSSSAVPMVGSRTTEGVAASNASAWHAAGYNGSGVKVAVIDGGFTGYTGLLGTDLPASVTTYDWTGTGLGDSIHGTACAEIVYDMAPGVTMYLHKINTDVEFGNAVNRAIADGVKIISASIGWPGLGPGDGTGFLANIVNNARSNGIFYASAAGNHAQRSWSGTFTDSDSDRFHEWAPGLEVNFFGAGDGSRYVIPAGTIIEVALHWDDWTYVNQDYDMELWYSDGLNLYFIAGSYDYQSGLLGQKPTEYIKRIARYTGYYGISIKKYIATRNVCLRLISSDIPLDKRIPERSLISPADSPKAIAVGAIISSYPYSIEPYSSRGPTFGPGGACTGGFTKPDIAAYARVSTVSYGTLGFAGTSAATPHVSGAAALVKAVYPVYTVTDLQNYLEANAIDLGNPGKDNLYGSGRLYLGSPPTPPPCTYSISHTSQSFGSSGGTGSIIVTAPIGCSWTATSNASWLTITSGSSGSGNGTVYYSVSANSSTSSRQGTITVTGGNTFTVSQSGTTFSPITDPVYRFWSPVSGSHFFTISQRERDYIIATWPYYWTYEGVAYYTYSTQQPGTMPVYRFWSPVSGSHFFTISAGERDYVIATWPYYWTYEGMAYYAYTSQQPGTSPIYRFWSPVSGSHFFTISQWERNYIIATWPYYWTYEGIAWYAIP